MVLNLEGGAAGAVDDRRPGVSGPYAWDGHLVAWGLLVVATVAVVAGHRRLQRSRPDPVPWTRRQRLAFGGATLAAAVALTWPLADLAAHWSLLALIVQRLLLVLAVPSLWLVGVPFEVLRWLTRPAPVDTVLHWVRRPAVAVVWVTVTMVGCLSVPLVRVMASSVAARGLIDLVVLVAGFVLWLPVMGRVPGPLRIEPWGRFGYLVVQAVVPAFLSFIYIFAKHPLYPTFLRSHLADGMRPVTDQQISGFASKLTMLAVLLSVGAVVLSRAQRLDAETGGEEPLVWADVERELERAERRDVRRHRPGSPGVDDEPPGDGTPPEP
jgi:cytochrome c oxidase assembly factor CtaG